MTIGPKKKISIAKSHQRHSTWEGLQLKKMKAAYQVATCTNCGAKKLAYNVCPVCGWYKGKQVITVKAGKKSEKIIDA